MRELRADIRRPAPVPAGLLAIVTAVLLWSAYRPADSFTWFLESAPVLVAVPLLIARYRAFRFTDLAYALIAIHCAILLIGGHYTYARVPPFDWLRDALHLSRNHYDRLGHFAQGFVPAIVGRELLLRTSPLRPGKWLFALATLSCLGISAAYELVEWAVAALSGTAADAFLGTQGDVWDTQKDMACALVGAVTALVGLAPLHDRVLARASADRG